MRPERRPVPSGRMGAGFLPAPLSFGSSSPTIWPLCDKSRGLGRSPRRCSFHRLWIRCEWLVVDRFGRGVAERCVRAFIIVEQHGLGTEAFCFGEVREHLAETVFLFHDAVEALRFGV